MNPKEKAIYLLANYRYALSLPNAPLGENKDFVAKQCALIGVDEYISIADENLSNFSNDDVDYFNRQLEYWQSVRTEITKL